MPNFVSLNRHQKKALVIQLYEQGKTRRQIAEVVHMGFKDIADVIRKHTGEDNSVNKSEKSKDARAFELFLQGKQSVEVAIFGARTNGGDAESQDVQIAAGNDNVIVTWWERNATSNEPVVTISTDTGTTFAPIMKLAANGTIGIAE
jgi:hypothetical protein